jgi:hypothetical protein
MALGALVLVAIVALIAYARSGPGPSPAPAAAAQTAAAPVQAPVPQAAEPAAAKFGPHRQASYPPVPVGAAVPVRPMSEVTPIYKFAADHPEVLGYVPCYCGCEREGHRGNDDCFVRRRAANGDAVEWEPHGMT